MNDQFSKDLQSMKRYKTEIEKIKILLEIWAEMISVRRNYQNLKIELMQIAIYLDIFQTTRGLEKKIQQLLVGAEKRVQVIKTGEKSEDHTGF